MSTPPELSSAELTKLYETMSRAEALDTRLLRGIRTGEFGSVMWPSRGQEAIAAAMGLALTQDDRLVTTYRGLHDHVAKGVPLVKIVGEVMGTTAGACNGKGGTMHIAWPEVGDMMTTGIVGSGLPIGVGLALAAKKQGTGRVTVVSFGDGASNTGSFHEAINLAALWKLPVVFVCQNNLYAEMTPIEQTMAVEHVADRAKGVAMKGVTVDGNDPVATYDAIKTAVDAARAGEGPTLVEAVTFRFEGHHSGDQMKYFGENELEERRAADPMVTFRQTLLALPDFTEESLDAIRDQAIADVEEAVQEAKLSPNPDLAELHRDIYAEEGETIHV